MAQGSIHLTENYKIGELMVSLGYISRNEMDVILREQRSSNILFGKLAVQMKFISDSELCKILSIVYKIDYIDLDLQNVCHEILITNNIFSEYQAIPFEITQSTICVAISDPGDIIATDALISALKCYKVKFFLADKQKIKDIISECSAIEHSEAIPYLNSVIRLAVEESVSDLHFTPNDNVVEIRARKNGVLKSFSTFPIIMWGRIRSKLKIMSDLNIADSRKPQSGHATLNISNKCIDMRISTHPSIFGECIAIRILDASFGLRKLTDLNFSSEDTSFLSNVIRKPSGIFLIVGPTGSGKTTTLYSLLQEINDGSLNIMTLEDPVEYQICGIRQLDIKSEGIISYSDGIKSILRQDPDVMLVGEIRDECTAAAILRASLTGRLVLGTLHATSPIDALRRLANLGVDMQTLASQLIGIFSQRLVRKKSEGDYKDRIPLTEYFCVNKVIEQKIYSNFFDFQLTKTFHQSVKDALNFTDRQEIVRVLGDAYI